jgi:beta-glucanase (GH16 family)
MISGFEWLPNKVTWFIDGRVVRTHYGGRPPIPDKSAKIMMNLWIFEPKANFGGKQIHNNRYPMTSEYAPWPKLMVWF